MILSQWARPLRRGLLFLGVVGFLVLLPGQIAAQQALFNAELRYGAALDAYNEGLAERDRLQLLHQEALDALEGARGGSAAAVGRASTLSLDYGLQLTRARAELTRRGSDLAAARTELLIRLDNRRTELAGLIRGSLPASIRTSHETELVQRGQQASAIREDVRGQEVLELRDVPDLVQSRFDLPVDLRNKAALLESRIATYDVQLRQVDEEIRILEDRARALRTAQELQSDPGRFDSNPFPGAGRLGGPRAVLPEAPGGTPVDQLPPAEQIPVYRQYRDLILEYQAEARVRARDLRAAAGDTP